MKAWIRVAKQRIRERRFVRAAYALHRNQSANDLLVIADSYGRLANRLTVLAHSLVHADRVNAGLVDVSISPLKGLSAVDDRYRCGGGLWFPPGDQLPGAKDAACIHRLVRFQNAFQKACERESCGRFRELAVAAGTSDQRIALSDLSQYFPDDRVISLAGIFVDAGDVNDAEIDRVKSQLMIAPSVQRAARSVVDTVKRDRIVVGVHVRHGDYRTWQDGRHFHELTDYYQGMQRIQAALGAPAEFLVVSDEKQDLTDAPRGIDARFVRETELQDLCLLSKCDYLLATHSSFANWSSFIGDVPLIKMRDALRDHDLQRECWKPLRFPRLQSDYLEDQHFRD